MALMAGIGMALAIAIASPTAFAVVVLALSPIPSIDGLVGVSLPTGMDPLTLLVVVGLGLTLQRFRLRLGATPLLTWLVALNLAVLTVAWLRTYGQGEISPSSLALFLKPGIVVLAGVLVVGLLPPEKRLRTLAYGMAGALLVVALSVVLHRAGLYRTAYQVANEQRLGFKQYGGLLGNGNTAGSFLAAFTLPAFVLLRGAGSRVLPWVLLAVTMPVLLVTFSRGSIIAFGVTLAALAVLYHRRLEGVLIAAGTALAGLVWSLTAGNSAATFLLENLSQRQGDANSQLSGRLDIWDRTFDYLNADPARWLVGGGLDAVRDFNLSSSLGGSFATHSAYLEHIANGGIVDLGLYAALCVVLFVLARGVRTPEGLALQLCVVATLVLGIASNFDLFTRHAAWVWVLAAAVIQIRSTVPAPRPTPAVRPTVHTPRGVPTPT
jgi:O-antigen ligase